LPAKALNSCNEYLPLGICATWLLRWGEGERHPKTHRNYLVNSGEVTLRLAQAKPKQETRYASPLLALPDKDHLKDIRTKNRFGVLGLALPS
jgi:hypothetical protein